MMCTLTKSSSLTPPESIKEIIVKPYERQDDVTYYPIHIITWTNETLELRYTYSDFIQFSRTLHKRYDVRDYQLHILKKQHSLLKRANRKYFERQLELEDFCQRLLLLPDAIKTSDVFCSFFWPSSKEPPSQRRRASLKSMFSIQSKQQSISSNSTKKCMQPSMPPLDTLWTSSSSTSSSTHSAPPPKKNSSSSSNSSSSKKFKWKVI